MDAIQASINDITEILELQKLAYKQEAEIYDDYKIPPLTQTLDELREEFIRSTVFKVVSNGSIVGSVRSFLDNGICNIGRLFVHPDFQNKGIGTMLMNTVETYFRNREIQKFELFTGEKSSKNIYLYQKLGFNIFKTEKLNDNVNIVYMSK